MAASKGGKKTGSGGMGWILGVLAVLAAGIAAFVQWQALHGATSAADRAFLAWLEDAGAKVNGIGVAQFEGMGHGVIALKNLEVDTTVLSLPPHMLMERGNIYRNVESGADILAEAGQNVSEEVLSARRELYKSAAGQSDAIVLSIYMIEQMFLGNASFWQPYLDVLPERVPRSPMFSDTDLLELQDSERAEAARQTHQDLVDEHEDLRALIAQVLKNAQTVNGASDEDMRTYLEAHKYLHVQGLIASRALTFQGRRVLAPLADMFNYKSTGEERAHESGEAFLKHHKWAHETDGFLHISTDRYTAAAGQVFEDYGDNPNHIYLQYHGFIPEENPFDCVSIQLPDAKGIIWTAKHIVQNPDSPFGWVLHGEGVPLDDNTLHRRQSGLMPPPKVCVSKRFDIAQRDTQYAIMYVLAALLHPAVCKDEFAEDPRELRQCLFSNAVRDTDLAVAIIREYAFGRLRSYPTSIEADEEIKPESYALELALGYRISQKRALLGFLGFEDQAEAAEEEAAQEEAAQEPEAQEPLGSVEGGVDAHLEGLVRNFNEWMDQAGAPHYHVRAHADPVFRVGAKAVKDIAVNEIYLGVPSQVIMSLDTAFAEDSGVRRLLESLRERFGRGDAFHELLFHLVYERFVLEDESRWWPYLALLPQPGQQTSTLFLAEHQIAALGPSTIRGEVIDYQARVHRQYDQVSGMDLVANFFPEGVFSREHYFWASAILDSRSIWWHGQRHLVPLLDLVNCAEGGPDPARVHSTHFEEATRSADTRADRPYAIGDQIFENYGQTNKIYYIHHGFILDANAHDALDVDLELSLGNLSEEDENYLKRLRLRNGANRFTIGGGAVVKSREGFRLVDERFEAFLGVKYGRIGTLGDLCLRALQETIGLGLAYAREFGIEQDPFFQNILEVLAKNGLPPSPAFDGPVVDAAAKDADARLAYVRKVVRSEMDLLILWLAELFKIYMDTQA
mmetsp:Transcript_6242/g.17456  ORF Transcript_6242/g.17456 Transcript_6242/m.17456 type:complete len:963 (-) Transcript_6242:85-2973(-)|eukprot:CAMPEP_0118879932 /NCGR_PEP_ID=MMETSP1163-20130328/19600_1 /TAXON_ID=124430 /ORGANISM="Phaeomonas parva, Strain CCMP2877" /LENGTH=962 /DNA_ID=CAMNT_0006816185 /DNA_START=68 /DNA_END=2956 /DNA_ORIENTATION=+